MAERNDLEVAKFGNNNEKEIMIEELQHLVFISMLRGGKNKALVKL